MYELPKHFSKVNAETHLINASYVLGGSGMPIPLEIERYELDTVVEDVLDFFNEMEESAADFDVHTVKEELDEFYITIRGHLYEIDKDGKKTEDEVETFIYITAI